MPQAEKKKQPKSKRLLEKINKAVEKKNLDTDALWEETRKELQFAKELCMVSYPFFGSLLLSILSDIRMAPKEMWQKCIVAGVTKYGRLLINPVGLLEIAHNQGPRQVMGILIHEVMHLALDSFGREGDRHHELWNMATDYAINDIILNTRPDNLQAAELPDWVLYNAEWCNLPAEEIYEYLLQDARFVYVSGDGESGLDGLGGDIITTDPFGGTKHDEEATRNRNRSSLVEAVRTARGIGTVPRQVQRFFDELTSPRVKWTDIIRAYFSQQCNQRVPLYTWNRPRKRTMSQGILLPGRKKLPGGKIAIMVDTSGSIGDNELTLFLSEMKSILGGTGVEEVHIISCDTEVHDYYFYRSGEAMKPNIEFHGGGGTDFDAAFIYLEEHRIVPDVLIGFTDFAARVSVPAPSYPVIWAGPEQTTVPEKMFKDESIMPFGWIIGIPEIECKRYHVRGTR